MLQPAQNSSSDASGDMQIDDYPSVAERLADLGCVFPEGFAVLPHNFSNVDVRGEFRLVSEASTVRTLLRNEGLPVGTILPASERPTYVSLNSFGWIGPTLFISAGLLSTNPTAVQIALGVLTNYLSDLLKGVAAARSVKLEVVVERKHDRVCKRIVYEGPLEGLESLSEAVSRVADDR